MNEHDILALLQIVTCFFTIVSQIVVLVQLRKLQNWVEWMREWAGRANARLKELEDWIEK